MLSSSEEGLPPEPTKGQSPPAAHHHADHADHTDEAHVEQCLHTNPEDEAIPDATTDERQCRICFAGVEEEEALGRLISPCLCTGSMRYVHVDCINAWRGTGTNEKAYVECPQCHFRYRLRRTRISGLATSRPTLLLSTLILFSSMSLAFGSILQYFLTRSPTLSQNLSSPSAVRAGSPFDFFGDDFLDGGGVVIIGGGVGGGSLVWDILVSAVQTFASLSENFGELQAILSEKLPGPAAVLIFGLFLRYLLGLAVLGSLSFVSLCISFSLFGPLQLANALRGGVFGSWGRRRLRLGGRNGENGGIGTVIVVFLVLVGAINTLRQVYSGVGKLAERLLRYVESQILEVNPDELKKEFRGEWWVKTWVKNGRWRTLDGWKEGSYRVWADMRRRIEGMRIEDQHNHEE